MHYGREGPYFVTSVMHLRCNRSYFVTSAGLPAKIFIKLEVLDVRFLILEALWKLLRGPFGGFGGF